MKPNRPEKPQRVILVTGPSGAGRSTAIKFLEDIGYEAIDNLPLGLLPRLLDGPSSGHPLTLGIDPRNRDFSTEAFGAAIRDLAKRDNISLSILYLDCSHEVLLRRYSETRRRHPLAPEDSAEVGIARERDLLQPIRALADVLVDTSAINVHELRDHLTQTFRQDDTNTLAVSIQSFSYKRGLPLGADMVLDCRFLSNPYWQPDLRALDGRDVNVARFVAEDERYSPFFSKVTDLVNMLLPAYTAEGKSHFSIAFGCTGGQHRSVAVAEALHGHLTRSGWPVSVRHREIDRRKMGSRA